MKKQIISTTALIIMAIVIGTSQLAQARTLSGRLVVHVPFDFVAGQQQLPAGRYTVRNAKTDSDTALIIQSEDGKQAAILLTQSDGGRAERARLTFRQYGDQFFLAGVWVPGTAGGRQLPESKQERRFRRELRAKAETGAEAKIVTVLGNIQ